MVNSPPWNTSEQNYGANGLWRGEGGIGKFTEESEAQKIACWVRILGSSLVSILFMGKGRKTDKEN